MPKKILPSYFNQRASFGTLKSIQNANVVGYQHKFIESFAVWVYSKKRTLSQQYQIYQTELQDSIILVARHNPKITDQLVVKYQEHLYRILNISRDDSWGFMKYDYITCKKIVKGGAKGDRT